jgi:hypothetical protein
MGTTIKLTNSPISKFTRILPTRVRIQLYVVILIQIIAVFLDLIGLLAIAFIGTLTVTSMRSKGSRSRVEEILLILGLFNLALQKQVAILGVLAGVLALSKTIFSILIFRKTNSFSGRRYLKFQVSLIQNCWVRIFSLLELNLQKKPYLPSRLEFRC